MSNAVIAYSNIADTGTLTASSASLLLPLSNIQVAHIARKWRGNSASTDFVVVDFGSLQSLDTVAVIGITGAQIRTRLSSTDATGAAGDAFDSGTIAVDQSYLSYISLVPSVVSARYLRVDITTTGLFVEIGRIFAGVKTQFAYNFIAGWTRTWNDLSTRTKTLSGQTQIFPRSVYRSYDVSFDFLKQVDRDGFVETIDRVNALKTDVLYISDPSSQNLSRDSVWGLMTALTAVIQPSPGIFTKQYQIEERL
jgi:hypothetical protein